MKSVRADWVAALRGDFSWRRKGPLLHSLRLATIAALVMSVAACTAGQPGASISDGSTDSIVCEDVPELVSDVVQRRRVDQALIEIGMARTSTFENTWVVSATFLGELGFPREEFVTNIPALGSEGVLYEIGRFSTPDPNGGPPAEYGGGFNFAYVHGMGEVSWLCANTFGHWTRDEERVRHDTINMFNSIYGGCLAAVHGVWEMRVAMPIGTVGDQNSNPQYVWDPEGLFGEPTIVGTRGDVALPEDAAFTGLRRVNLELWLAETDSDLYAYLLWDGHLQRWRRSQPALVCVDDAPVFEVDS